MSIHPQPPSGGLDAPPLKILFLSAELAPIAQVGGLADVAGALPSALNHLGQDVRVMLPRYGGLPNDFPLAPVIPSLTVPLRLPHSRVSVHEGRVNGTVPLYVSDRPQYFSTSVGTASTVLLTTASASSSFAGRLWRLPSG